MPKQEMLHTGSQHHRTDRPAMRELPADERRRVKGVFASEFGGPRSDETSLQRPALSSSQSSPRREPLPEPRLPELRELMRYVCALEAGGHGAGSEPEDRKRRVEQVRIESGIEHTLTGEQLACVNASCRLVRLCIFEGGERIEVLDREDRVVRIAKAGLTSAD